MPAAKDWLMREKNSQTLLQFWTILRRHLSFQTFSRIYGGLGPTTLWVSFLLCPILLSSVLYGCNFPKQSPINLLHTTLFLLPRELNQTTTTKSDPRKQTLQWDFTISEMRIWWLGMRALSPVMDRPLIVFVKLWQSNC